MATEAVLKIKEAEEKASATLKNADVQAKEILKKAESDAALKRETVIGEANKVKAGIIETALKKAEEDCKILAGQGDAEKKRILNPAQDALDGAAQYAIERIVNANGNS